MLREKKSNREWLAVPAAMGLATLLSVAAVQAQPDANNAPKGDNPPAAPVPPRGGGGNRPNWRNMTPEQREVLAQQWREQGLRWMLTNAEFNDKALQDAIVAFANEQDKARRLLQDQFRKLGEATRNKETTDAQLNILLADFRADVAADNDRRTAALAALDEKIGYTKKPRLDYLLMTMGLTGDEMAAIGIMGGPGMGGFGGQGGRGGGGQGGRGGGGQGGRGGQGGGGNAPAGNPPAAVG